MFNSSRKFAFGLDISDRSLKIVQLERRNGILLVSSYINKPIPEGVIEGGEVRNSQSLSAILRDVSKQSKGAPLTGKEVVCNLPEEKVFIRIIKLPVMKREELAKAVRWEAEAHIPLNISEVYLDWHLLPASSKSSHFNILVAAAPQDLVDKHLLALKQGGLRPIAFEPESIAVVRALMREKDHKPTIIVDLGQTGTNFVVFAGPTIRFTSHIPISGRAFNRAIVKEMGINMAEANQLKIKIGLDKTKKRGRVYKALLPIINDLAKQIEEYIKFCHNQVARGKGSWGTIEQVVLCGGDSLLVNLIPVLDQRLNLSVRLGNPLINISPGGKKGSAFANKGFRLFKRQLLGYTTAIGLALREAK